jgi:uncharacterized protein
VNAVTAHLGQNGKGAFVIERGGERQAEMVVGVDEKNITVYHTEVSPALKGQNAGTLLLNAMTDYARQHHLMVIALCPFVSAQFKRHSEKYADLWNQHWHSEGKN